MPLFLGGDGTISGCTSLSDHLTITMENAGGGTSIISGSATSNQTFILPDTGGTLSVGGAGGGIQDGDSATLDDLTVSGDLRVSGTTFMSGQITASGGITTAGNVFSSGFFRSERAGGASAAYQARFNGNLGAEMLATGTLRIGGAIPADPQIELNADGSATFASGDIELFDNGRLSISGGGITNANTFLFRAFSDNTTVGSQKAVLFSDGEFRLGTDTSADATTQIQLNGADGTATYSGIILANGFEKDNFQVQSAGGFGVRLQYGDDIPNNITFLGVRLGGENQAFAAWDGTNLLANIEQADGSAMFASGAFNVADNGVTTISGDFITGLNLVGTDDGNRGPRINMLHRSASPADGDDVGGLFFQGLNSNDAAINYANIQVEAASTTAATASGNLVFGTTNNGSNHTSFQINADGTTRQFGANGAVQEQFICGLEATSNLNQGGNGICATVSGGTSGGTQVGIRRGTGTSAAASYYSYRRFTNNSSFVWVDQDGDMRIGDLDQVGSNTDGTVIGDQTSDLRLKKDITDYTAGLAAVKQLRPVNFKYKDSDTVHAGFIAQEVSGIIPEAVSDTGQKIEVTELDSTPMEDGSLDSVPKVVGYLNNEPNKLSMAYVELIPALVNAVKELAAEIEALKSAG